MLLGEATLHYGIDGHELLAYVGSGELCALCYEHFGNCEHTKEDGMEDWMKEALSGFLDKHRAEFERYLVEACFTGTGESPEPAVSEILDELRPRE